LAEKNKQEMMAIQESREQNASAKKIQHEKVPCQNEEMHEMILC